MLFTLEKVIAFKRELALHISARMAILRKNIDIAHIGAKAEMLAVVVCVGRGFGITFLWVPGCVDLNVNLY